MQDAFIDNSVLREEVIHKIVEVKVWDDKTKAKKEKKKNATADGMSVSTNKRKGSDSDSSDLNVEADEKREIKEDKKNIKQYIKTIKGRIDSLGRGEAGVDEMFRFVDKDGSAEIELNEFI